jgi:hypothetical protein
MLELREAEKDNSFQLFKNGKFVVALTEQEVEQLEHLIWVQRMDKETENNGNT